MRSTERQAQTIGQCSRVEVVDRTGRFFLLVAFLSTACGHGDSRPTHSPDMTLPRPTSPALPREIGQGNSIEPKRTNGKLAPEVIQKVVRANFDRMRACYEAGLRKSPNLRGRISTRFVIELDGRVSSAYEVHEAPSGQQQKLTAEPRFPDEAVVSCVVATFAAMNFPQPQSGTVTVIYPINFAPDEATP